jgi:hypothetical protein
MATCLTDEYEGLVLFRLERSVESFGFSVQQLRAVLSSGRGICYGNFLVDAVLGRRVESYFGKLSEIYIQPVGGDDLDAFCESLDGLTEPLGFKKRGSDGAGFVKVSFIVILGLGFMLILYVV